MKYRIFDTGLGQLMKIDQDNTHTHSHKQIHTHTHTNTYTTHTIGHTYEQILKKRILIFIEWIIIS